jgi:hypothetical protein
LVGIGFPSRLRQPHLFLRIDNVAAGTNYTLEFPFAPRFAPDSKTQGCLEIKNRSLLFTKEAPLDQAIWVRLEGFEKREDNEIKIANHKTGGTMTITRRNRHARKEHLSVFQFFAFQLFTFYCALASTA